MTSIYLPTTRPDDWKRLLAKPDLHWKPGYSAWAVAHAWEAANGVPSEIARLFENSDHFKGQRVELLWPPPNTKFRYLQRVVTQARTMCLLSFESAIRS